jgi:hypothetical protein
MRALLNRNFSIESGYTTEPHDNGKDYAIIHHKFIQNSPRTIKLYGRNFTIIGIDRDYNDKILLKSGATTGNSWGKIISLDGFEDIIIDGNIKYKYNNTETGVTLFTHEESFSNRQFTNIVLGNLQHIRMSIPVNSLNNCFREVVYSLLQFHLSKEIDLCDNLRQFVVLDKTATFGIIDEWFRDFHIQQNYTLSNEKFKLSSVAGDSGAGWYSFHPHRKTARLVGINQNGIAGGFFEYTGIENLAINARMEDGYFNIGAYKLVKIVKASGITNIATIETFLKEDLGPDCRILDDIVPILPSQIPDKLRLL